MMDTARHKGLRRMLVEDLAKKGIKNINVLNAMNKIPRHVFIESAFTEIAYQDKAFNIGDGQTISHPSTVAIQSDLLEIVKGLKVLEIGTGSGYQACVLAELGARVFTIERHKSLHLKSKEVFKKLGYQISSFVGDGYLGLEEFAPFDRIIVTCGAPEIPLNLVKQLKVNGIMIVPVGDKSQVMYKVIRNTETTFEVSEHGDFKFVPMLERVKIRK